MAQSETRQRERPEARFAAPEETLDLKVEAQRLIQEPASGQRGHRQKALIREGPLTLALYVLEAGARLPNHVVDGVVLIQTLRGHASVTTEQGTHDLPAGCVLRLSSGVRHDLAAPQASEVLVTIALEGPDSHP